MPLRLQQPDPTKFFRAWQSFASPAGSCRHGERVRGDDARYLGNPSLFVPDGTPASAWPSAFTQPEIRNWQTPAERLPAVEPSDVRVCTTPIVLSEFADDQQLDAVEIGKGTRLHRLDSLVVSHPECFGPAPARRSKQRASTRS
jgi:hypothetical protein